MLSQGSAGSLHLAQDKQCPLGGCLPGSRCEKGAFSFWGKGRKDRRGVAASPSCSQACSLCTTQWAGTPLEEVALETHSLRQVGWLWNDLSCRQGFLVLNRPLLLLVPCPERVGFPEESCSPPPLPRGQLDHNCRQSPTAQPPAAGQRKADYPQEEVFLGINCSFLWVAVSQASLES